MVGSSAASVQQQLSQILEPIKEMQERLLRDWSEMDGEAKADPEHYQRYTTQKAALQACHVIAGFIPQMAQVLEDEEGTEGDEERRRQLYRRMKARQQWRIRCTSKGCSVVKTRRSGEKSLDAVLTGRVVRLRPLSHRRAGERGIEGLEFSPTSRPG